MPRRLVADVAWLWVGYVGRSVAYLGLVFVMTRSLGADEYGRLSLFLAIALGVSQLAGGWPFLAIPVLSARSSISAAARPTIRVGAWATLAMLAIAVPALLAMQGGGLASAARLAVYAVALVGLQLYYAILQSQGRMGGIALLQTLERVIALVAMVGYLALASLTRGAAEALLGAAAVAALLVGAIGTGKLSTSGDSPRTEGVRSVLSAVGALGVVSVCSYGVAWIDLFILSALRSDAEVGVYSLGYQIYTFTIQIGSLWAVAALPRHVRSIAAGKDPVSSLPLPPLVAGAKVWAGACAAGAVVAALLLPTVFGQDFSRSGPPLMILLGGTIVTFGYFVATPVAIAASRAKAIASIAVLAVSINLALDLALVPIAGVYGPAIATSVQGLISAVAILVVVCGRRVALAIVAAGTPAAIATTVLALDLNSPLLLTITGIVALGSLVSGARAFPRGSAPALSPEAQPLGQAQLDQPL